MCLRMYERDSRDSCVKQMGLYPLIVITLFQADAQTRRAGKKTSEVRFGHRQECHMIEVLTYDVVRRRFRNLQSVT